MGDIFRLKEYKNKNKRPNIDHYRIAHLITMNPSVIYFYTYQYFCHKLVLLANHPFLWESSKELYCQKLENHTGDSDLFPLQYNHSLESLGELIPTEVIGQSNAASVLRDFKNASDTIFLF